MRRVKLLCSLIMLLASQGAQAVSYPLPHDSYADDDIVRYFSLCRLDHLAGRLDDADNWSQRLSPGEQQRLAFVRVLLIQPDIVFLDEATSAMDGDTEAALYSLLTGQLSGSTIVSIAHRETVAQYHELRWQFVADGAQASDGGWRYRIDASVLSVGAQDFASHASARRTQ